MRGTRALWATALLAFLVHGSQARATSATTGDAASAIDTRKLRFDPPSVWIAPSEVFWPDDGAKAPAQEGPSGRRYLLFDTQVRLGASETERYSHWVQQIVNESGLQSASQVNIDFDPSYETLVLHSVNVRRGDQRFDRLDRGAIRLVQREPNLEAQFYDGRQSAVLFVSDLRVGDVIDYAFTIRSSDPTLNGQYADNILLGLPEPVGRLRARILLPATRRLRVALQGPGETVADMRPQEHDGPAVTELFWERLGVAAFPIEPDAPSEYDPIPYAQISEFASWHDVAVWGVRLFHVPSPTASSAVRAWTQARLREHPATSDFLLDAIRFVQDEVRYVAIEVGMGRRKPSDPAAVFDRRYGDCKDKSALLVAILGAAGIDARPALVSTTHGLALGDYTPSPAVFDHVIVRVAPSNGEIYWVDPTIALQGGGLGRLRRSTFAMALPLDEMTTGLEAIELPHTIEPSPSVADEFTVELPESHQETKLISVRTYRSRAADVMRSVLRTLSGEQAAKHFMSLYEKDYPAIHSIAPLEQSDDRVKNIVRVVTRYGIPGFWIWDEKAHVYRCPVSARSIEQLLPSAPPADRSAPLGLVFPLHTKYAAHFALPFALGDSPEAVHFEGPAFDFHFDSAFAKSAVTYTYELLARSSSVRHDHFDEHRDLVTKVQKTLFRELTYFPPLRNGPNVVLIAAFVLCLPVFGWATHRIYRYAPKRDPSDADPRIVPNETRRIGGWLILLAINVTLLPFHLARTFFNGAKTAFSAASWAALTTAERPSYRPGLAALIAVEMFIQLWLVAYAAVLAALFFGKKRSFPGQFTIASLSIVALVICDQLAVSLLLPSKAFEMGLVVRTAIWSAVWIAYLRSSTRAALTFVVD